MEINPGDQSCFEMGYSPTAIKIENLDQGKDTTIRYAWIYNDVKLIASPSTDTFSMNAGGGRTVQPPQKDGVNPSTFVLYNEGPAMISADKLG